MRPNTEEKEKIDKLNCPLCKDTVGYDVENYDGHPTMLVLYCKNMETCGIEIKKLQVAGWDAIVEHWRNLK